MTTQTGEKTKLPRPAVGTGRLLRRGKTVIEYFVGGEGETVVLLPAFARSVSDYNELAVSLRGAGYRTVGIQPRGMGQSTSPIVPRASMHDFAADVAAVVEDLGDTVGGKVHMIGRAFGARVARTLAADRPQLVQSAVLLAGGGAISRKKSHLLRYILCNFRFIPQRWRDRAQAVMLYAPGNPIAPHLVYRHALSAVRRQLPAMRTPLEEVWRDTKIPVLYVQGEEDVLVPVENAYALRDRFGGQLEVVVIPHAGHALLPEQPEAVFRTVAAFLREHAITAAACGR